MVSSKKYSAYPYLFTALNLRPRMPSDPHEAYIMLLQNMPELSHIVTVGLAKQS